MKNKKDKEYKDTIKKLREFRSISASDDLKDEIMFLSKTSPNGNSRFGGIFLTKAIAFTLVFLLLTGGTTLVAAQKSRPGQILYPVRQTIEKIKQESTSNNQEGDNPEMNNASKNQEGVKQSTQSADTNQADDKDQAAKDKNGSGLPEDTKNNQGEDVGKKDEVLGEIKENLPEKAQRAVQDAIENPTSSSNDKKQNSNQGQQENDLPADVQVNLPEKAQEAKDENKGLKIDINLPF